MVNSEELFWIVPIPGVSWFSHIDCDVSANLLSKAEGRGTSYVEGPATTVTKVVQFTQDAPAFGNVFARHACLKLSTDRI